MLYNILPKDNYVVFDFETTGFFDTPNSEVIQLSAIKFFKGEKFSFNAFVKVNQQIPEQAVAVHGITNELLEKEGIDKERAWTDFFDFVRGFPLIGHNSVNFDKKFLDREFKKFGFPIPSNDFHFDTAMLYKAKKAGVIPRSTEPHYDFCVRVGQMRIAGLKFNLGFCCEELGIDTSEFTAHRADSDIEMTHLIYIRYIQDMQEEIPF